MAFSVAKLADAFADVEELDFRVQRVTLNPGDLEEIYKTMRDSFATDRGRLIFWNAVMESEDSVPVGHVKIEPKKPPSEKNMKIYRRIMKVYEKAWNLENLPKLKEPAN